MKKTSTVLISFLVFTILALPVLSFAQSILPSPVPAPTSNVIKKVPGFYLSQTDFARVTILNANPRSLKLRFEYGINDFGLRSNILIFDDEGHGQATMGFFNNGNTYQYRLFDVNGILSPSDTETFFYSGPFSSGSSGFGYGGYRSVPNKTTITIPTTPPIATTITPPNTTPTTPPIATTITPPNTTPITPPIATTITPPNTTPSGGLVQCGKSGQPQCDFNDFMDLINSVIRFILIQLAVPIAAIMFFYAGFKMVTSGGSTEARAQAKSIFTNTVLGLVYIAGAWLLVRTLLSILGYQGAWIGF